MSEKALSEKTEEKNTSPEQKIKKKKKKLKAKKINKIILKSVKFRLGIVSGIALVLLIALGVMIYLQFFNNNFNKKQTTLEPISNEDWIRGDRFAQVSIIEYSDTECPYCKNWHSTLKELVQEYDGKVNWVYRHHPIEELHKKSFKEALATECIGEIEGNDKFWEYLDKIYETTESNDKLEEAKLPEFAEEVGADKEKFEQCLKEEKYKENVEEDIDNIEFYSAEVYSKISPQTAGTPFAVIVSDRYQFPIGGAYSKEYLTDLIDKILAK